MRILAVETTDQRGSVAVTCDGKLLAELTLDPDRRSAQSLAPGLVRILEQVGCQPADVRLVAVTVGPGSFTGLRVGVMTAKAFAYAVGAEVLGVDTLETIAAGAPADVAELFAVMDAQRGDVVAQRFRRGPEGWFLPTGPQELIPIETWFARLTPDVAVAGPVLEKLLDRLPAGVRALDRAHWAPRASVVARLAERQYAEGRRDDVWALAPKYCRRSAAEEKVLA